MCGALIQDGTRICILEAGHGPHGGEAKAELGPLADVRTILEDVIEHSKNDPHDPGLLALSGTGALAALTGRMSAHIEVLARAMLEHLDREHGGAA